MARYKHYAPSYKIRLDGTPLPPELHSAISSVSWTTGMEGADRVELTLANISLRLLDHPLLTPDREFRLSVGYAPDPLEEVFVGEITGIESAFPSGGAPTLHVTAQDYLNRMMKGKKDRSFRLSIPGIGNFPLPDSLITALVAGLDGLIATPDPTGSVLSTLISLGSFLAFPQFAQGGLRKQVNESDFDLLSDIAKESGWEMFIDHSAEPKGRVLKFQFVLGDATPSLSLAWGANLVDFTPRLTTIGDIFGVTARVWVDSLKIEFVIVVSWNYDTSSINLLVYPNLVGDIEDFLGPEARGNTITVKPTGFAAAPRHILAELLPRLNNRLTGTGSTIGDPAIVASRVIELSGLGGQFSGLYRVTSATHTFDGGGYKTSFHGRREVWFPNPPMPNRTGAIPRLQGAFSV
jgi:hypothetical protein